MSVSLFSQDPAFSDLTPIPQQDAPNALVPIMYSLEYQDAMGYFRAISAQEERSQRALDVTLRVIRLNPAHYTVWQYRFKTLIALGASLEDELDLMTQLAEDNMKSYQVWHHRLLLLTHLPPPIPLSTVRAELAFISRSLLPDAKNYHTWAYRQFVLSHFGAALTEDDWAEERAWTDALLRVETGAASLTALEGENDEEGDWEEEEIGEGHRGDVRNNSAWGHRWFLYFGRADAPGEAALNDEIEYTKSQIFLVPNNASSWAYLRGLHTKFRRPLSVQDTFAQEVLAKCRSQGGDATCSLALEWLADSMADQGNIVESDKHFSELEKVDPIRRMYWKHRKSENASVAAAAA